MKKSFYLILACTVLFTSMPAIAQVTASGNPQSAEATPVDSPANDRNEYAHQRNLRVTGKPVPKDAIDDTGNNADDGRKITQEGMGTNLDHHVSGTSR